VDSFQLIQHFFTTMQCAFCTRPFQPEGIELLREDEGCYLVSVSCHHCERQIGVAMVGVEIPGVEMPGADLLGGNAQGFLPGFKPDPRFVDPELTPEELERLEQFEPIAFDDVLQAHEFFNQLDGNWMKFIPADMRERLQSDIRDSSAQDSNT
jgi:hypothetical protein